jgi:hypothetical protein
MAEGQAEGRPEVIAATRAGGHDAGQDMPSLDADLRSARDTWRQYSPTHARGRRSADVHVGGFEELGVSQQAAWCARALRSNTTHSCACIGG